MDRPSRLATVLATMAVNAVVGCAGLQEEPLEPPAVSIRVLEPEAFGLNVQVFRARLSLFNPNGVPLRVSRGELDLTLAGVRAAKGRSREPFTVPADGGLEVEFRVTTNLLRDAPALFSALAGEESESGISYALEGYVDVEQRGRKRIPIRASGVLGIAGPAPGDGPITQGHSEL